MTPDWYQTLGLSGKNVAAAGGQPSDGTAGRRTGGPGDLRVGLHPVYCQK